MSIDFIDESNKSRSDEDLQEAIDVVLQIMIKQPLVLPSFTVHAGIIIDCLHELQAYRRMIAKIKAEKEGL